MYAQLGNIRFEGLKGFDTFSGTKAANYAAHALIEGKPRLQRLGTDLEELQISVSLHSAFCNPETEIDDLDQARETGDVLPLVLGNGVYVGDFILQSIQRTVSQTDREGGLVSVQLQLQLKEFYDPDKLGSRQRAAQKNGFANSTRGAQVRITAPPKFSEGMMVADGVSDISLATSSVDTDVIAAGANADQQPFFSERIAGNLEGIAGKVDEIIERIEEPQLGAHAGEMPAALNAMKVAAYNMLAIMPITNIGDVRTANDALQLSAGGLRSASQALFNQVAIRNL